MAKKVVTESSTANYKSIDEIPHITSKIRALGFELTQAHHCGTKTKSYIINAKIGEPGLLYTNDLTKIEEFIKSHEGKQLAGKQAPTREVPEDTESGSKEEEATQEHDGETEEE